MANLTIDDVLEAMWASVADRFKISDRRHLIAKWKRLFKKTGITPRRYLCVLCLGNNHFLVESEGRPGQMHAIDWQHGELSCTCEDSTYRGHKCKHCCLVIRLQREGVLPE